MTARLLALRLRERTAIGSQVSAQQQDLDAVLFRKGAAEAPAQLLRSRAR